MSDVKSDEAAARAKLDLHVVKLDEAAAARARLSYRDNAAPPPPPAPPRFSPLRPLKRAVWWLLTAQALPPLHEIAPGEPPFGSLMLFIAPWVLTAFVASMVYFGPGATGAAREMAFWLLCVCCALPLIRLWLRSAMRLDEPETRSYWEERFR